MLSAIVSLLQGIIGWLNSVLPSSPFQDLLNGAEGLQLGLGWLNWFVPIGGMLAVFTAFLAALIAYAVFKLILDKGSDTVTSIVKAG